MLHILLFDRLALLEQLSPCSAYSQVPDSTQDGVLQLQVRVWVLVGL